MKKSRVNGLVAEDKTIENAVEKSVSIFEDFVRGPIEEEFEKYLHKHSSLKAAAFDSIEGGKHLRSYSTVLFYKLAGGKKDDFKKIAAALELIHCASLIVDDEIDKVEVRPDRNTPSIRGKYSPEEAFGVSLLEVLYATHLLFDGTDHLEKEKKNKIRTLFVKLVTDGETGEIYRWKFTQQRKIASKKEYWDDLIGPIAGLFFQLTGEIGAIAATEDKELIQKTGQLAFKIGELLQAGDDLKDLKEDIREGFYSLPVINYYDSLNSNKKKEFTEKLSYKLSEKAINDVYYEIVYSKSMEKTIEEIKGKGDAILKLLKTFPETTEKKQLEGIIKYLKNRMKIVS